jgi:ABC-type phosphate/phosphonate transport system substrate-binding protein
MSHTLKFAPLLLALAASLPARAGEPDPTAAARQASMLLIKTLGGELKASMASVGPEQTIAVCKERAPEIAADLSKQTGMYIHRVSARNRNPDAVPDAWEAEAIAGLEKRLAAGEKPETLEVSALVDGPKGKTFRYAKALVTQPLCLTCHGTPQYIPAGVKAKIASEYPHDKAVGYGLGTLRGIVSVRKAM